MAPAALLEGLSVILMIHLRRPVRPAAPARRFRGRVSISVPLDVVSSINEPHLYGQHLGCGLRQTLKLGSLAMCAPVRVLSCSARSF